MIDWLKEMNGEIPVFWNQYHTITLMVLGLAGVAMIAVAVIMLKLFKKKIKPVFVKIGSNLALLLNAEGMWDIATRPKAEDGLALDPGFAILVFAVFELMLLISMDLAEERYKSSTERDPETNKVIKPGNPGGIHKLVWTIAIVSGLIVASGAGSPTEVLLRIALPVIVVSMWWVVMTAEGRTRKPGKFIYSPRNIAISRGWIDPDGEDERTTIERMRRTRAIRQVVTLGYKSENGVKILRVWRKARLHRLMENTQRDILAQAIAQRKTAKLAVNLLLGDGRDADQELALVAELQALLDGSTGDGLTGQPKTSRRGSNPTSKSSSNPTSAADQSTSSLDEVDQVTGQTDEPVGGGSLTAVERKAREDALLVAAVRSAIKENDGRMISQNRVREVITPPGSVTTAGPDKAKRIIKLAGLEGLTAGDQVEEK